MKRWKLHLLPAVVLFLSLFSGVAAHAQITPSADAYTNTASPTTNYGSNPLLGVDGATQVTYIQFNLASIPAGSSVSQATLKIYVNAVTTGGSFNVDYVNGTWDESTITSNLAPALGGTIESGVAITTADKNQYILINVTPAVVAWLDGSKSNDGIALVANSSFDATFDSKENTTTSHPAELDIVFSASGGGGTITGVLTGSSSGLTGGGTKGTLNLSLSTACATNQVLQWNGHAWVCAAAGTGTITGVTTANGSGLTGGGTSGTLALGLTKSCSSGQVLQWNGSAWACTSLSGGGTINGVTAGTDLTGGGTSGTVTLNLDTTKVPQLNAANTFNTSQTVNGNLSATGVVSGSSYQLGSNLFAFGNYLNGNAFFGFAGNASMTGNANTATGWQSLLSNTTGVGNTAIGSGALPGNTTGGNNAAFGTAALGFNISGGFNTAIGEGALFHNQTGTFNTALGADADVGTFNLTNATAIGAEAVVNISNALVLGRAGTNVGIGIYAPAATLDVPGFNLDTYIGNPGCGANPFAGIAFGTAGFQSCQNYSMVGDGSNTYVAAPTGSIYFRTNSNAVTAMTIDVSGNVNIAGSLSKGSGSFKIDHPLDPANKYLYHSFVESPDMMNIYNGVAILDAHGSAWIMLPDYFEALNRDFRYQLTAIGAPGPNLYIVKKVSGNRFKIGGGKPKGEVSWQVTGIRQDAYANAHRIPNDEEKPTNERGKYLHPELFGASEDQAIGYRPSRSSIAADQVAVGKR
jgi:hypothetical protein